MATRTRTTAVPHQTVQEPSSRKHAVDLHCWRHAWVKMKLRSCTLRYAHSKVLHGEWIKRTLLRSCSQNVLCLTRRDVSSVQLVMVSPACKGYILVQEGILHNGGRQQASVASKPDHLECTLLGAKILIKAPTTYYNIHSSAYHERLKLTCAS